MKKVLHLLSGGGAGGIETLCEQIGLRGEYQHEFCFLFSTGVIADRMKEKRITTYDLSVETFLKKQSALKKIFVEGKYDAVVVHNEGVKMYLLYEALIKAAGKEKMLDASFIKYLHMAFDDDFYTGNKIVDTIHHYLLGKTVEDSDSVVAVSEFTKKTYVDELGSDEDKIKVIYNGIDNSNLVELVGRKSVNGNRLLYIGRLVDVKGVDVLIRAISVLKNRGIEVTLDLLGDGEARDYLKGLTDQLELSEQVFFHGVVLEKQEFFDKDGIFVYPSICQEAFGISIIEAMSQGLVCVASRVGGIPEIITEKDQGILFEAGNPEALADAIIEAKKRCLEGAYSKYRDAILSRASEYGIEKAVSELEALI